MIAIHPHAPATLRSPRGARGFTLLEVLTATVLSLLLLGALYAALDMHWKYSTAGQAEVERSQLARALLQRIALDLRGAMFHPVDELDEGEEDWLDEEDGGSASAETTEIRIENPLLAPPSGAAELLGDSQNILFSISRPMRGLDYSMLMQGDQLQSRSSDLQTVAWFLADPQLPGLPGLVGQRFAAMEGAGTRARGSRGIARLQGDRLALMLADSSGNLELMAEQSELLASEVVNLQFRYFDGVNWNDTWDSAAFNALPRAVEIVLEFEDELPGYAGASESTGGIRTVPYRLVVALPTSEPVDPNRILSVSPLTGL